MRTCLAIRELFRGPDEASDPVPALFRRTLRALAAQGGDGGDGGDELHVLTSVSSLPDELRAEVESLATLHDIDHSGDSSLDAFPCKQMCYSMAIHRTLRALHTLAPLDRIHLPAANAEGYFTLRAARSLDEFAGVTISLAVQSPVVVRRFLDRRLTATTEQAFADHAEFSAIAEADLLVAQTREQFDALDAAADGAGWLERIRSAERRMTGPILDGSRVVPIEPSEPATRPSVLVFGPLRHSSGAHTLVTAVHRLLASGVDLEVRFVGADLAEASFDRVMSEWLRRKAGSAWSDRFGFELGVEPTSTGFVGADAGGIGVALDAGVRVCCFPGADAGCAGAAAEALAAGACVVAVAGSPASELIDNARTGLVAPASDPVALAEALGRVLTDAALAARFGDAARREAASGPTPDPLPSARRPRATTADIRVTGTSPRVSVVIPFYNLGAWLPDTLRSVRAQTYTNYEIIVVDDGSTDAASLSLLDHLPERGVRVVRRVNGGLAAARNTGLHAATSDLVLTLDADDLLDPRYLETTVGVFERDRTGRLAVVSTPIKLFRESPDKPISGWIPLGLDREMLPFINVGACASCLMRRDALLGVGGYDEFLVSYEDWDLWCSLAGAGYTASIVPEFLFYYRVRDDGVFRQFCVPNHFRYKSYLLEKHAGLPTRPGLAARLALAEAKTQQDRADWLTGELDAMRSRSAGLEADLARSVTFEEAAERMRRENIRYRVVDKLNNAVKSSGLHAPVKLVARKLTGRGGGSNTGAS